LNGSDVIPDARNARSGIQSKTSVFELALDYWPWIPAQAFGLPGMTRANRADQPESVS
jgi:hypothetical protein